MLRKKSNCLCDLPMFYTVVYKEIDKLVHRKYFTNILFLLYIEGGHCGYVINRERNKHPSL